MGQDILFFTLCPFVFYVVFFVVDLYFILNNAFTCAVTVIFCAPNSSVGGGAAGAASARMADITMGRGLIC